LRQIDARHLAVGRIGVEREARAYADFEDAGTWRYLQSGYDRIDAACEDMHENMVIDA
jgi:hypothetical protein